MYIHTYRVFKLRHCKENHISIKRNDDDFYIISKNRFSRKLTLILFVGIQAMQLLSETFFTKSYFRVITM